MTARPTRVDATASGNSIRLCIDWVAFEGFHRSFSFYIVVVTRDTSGDIDLWESQIYGAPRSRRRHPARIDFGHGGLEIYSSIGRLPTVVHYQISIAQLDEDEDSRQARPLRESDGFGALMEAARARARSGNDDALETAGRTIESFAHYQLKQRKHTILDTYSGSLRLGAEMPEIESDQGTLGSSAQTRIKLDVELFEQRRSRPEEGTLPKEPEPVTARPPALAVSAEESRMATILAITRGFAARLEERSLPRVEAHRGGVELCLIPGGTFFMGSSEDEEGHQDSEAPMREVTVEGFYMAETPVTNAQYTEYLHANPDAPKPASWDDHRYNRPDQPVIGISWREAMAYCKWAGLSLPTEAEWEYACRAGTTTRYWSGDRDVDLARVGWYQGNNNGTPMLQDVAQRAANGFGLHDMHGNVFEYCRDTVESYESYPLTARSRGRFGSEDAPHVVRGGSFLSSAENSRSASRARSVSSSGPRLTTVGFRPVYRHHDALREAAARPLRGGRDPVHVTPELVRILLNREHTAAPDDDPSTSE